MCFDSSPQIHLDDSGYAEHWPGAQSPIFDDGTSSHLLQPARVPFYPPHVNPASPVLSNSPASPATPDSPNQATRRNLQGPPPTTPPASPSHALFVSRYTSSSPSYLELPPRLGKLQYLSDIPPLEDPPVAINDSPLPPSDLSCFSWSERTSRLPDSDEIPQASFSQSYEGSEEYQTYDLEPVQSPRAHSSQCSVYSSLEEDAQENASLAGAWPTWADQCSWEYVSLSDILGELFEDADPWRVLDQVLDLPPTEPDWYPDADGLNFVEEPTDRRGVDYVDDAPSPTLQGWPTSQTLADWEDDNHFDPVPSMLAAACPRAALDDDPEAPQDMLSDIIHVPAVEVERGMKHVILIPPQSSSPSHSICPRLSSDRKLLAPDVSRVEPVCALTRVYHHLDVLVFSGGRVRRPS